MRHLLIVAGTATALGLGTLTVQSSEAATPSPQSVTVPTKAGQKRTITWDGEIAPGTNPTSNCDGGTSPADIEEITVAVPEGAYDKTQAVFEFSITWEPVAAEEASDEILTVVRQDDGTADPEAESDNEVGSSDGSQTTERVTASDLPAATYEVQACGFANTAPQPYTGKLVIRTRGGGGGEQRLPSAPARGLAFTAGVASDPQRDEAEPLIESAPDGRTYTCGPTGVSAAADYAQVSTDGGRQFHLLGKPPRGEQSGGGGGDCAVAIAPAKNPAGHYQYAYTGLGPLTGFATTTSPDNGRTLTTAGPAGNGLQDTGVLADRQWLTFLDADSVLLSYNQQDPRNIVVQRSDDGGLTYGPTTAVGGASPDFPGPMRTLPGSMNPENPGTRVVFFGWSKGSHVNLSLSYDGGASFVDCVAAVDKRQPSSGFVSADADRRGNIYLSYADGVDFHSYLVTLRHGRLGDCDQPVGESSLTSVAPKNDPQDVGFSKPLQVDRKAVRSTVFPWVAADGKPGRVAVAFYGARSDGDPNQGSFKGTWDVYVNQSLNALSRKRTFSQVKATTHPMHYDSICLNGLGCSLSTPEGDRTLADFFAIETNQKTHLLQVVFNNDAKKPSEDAGHVATPMVFTQTRGPSMAGGKVREPHPRVVRQRSRDHKGDAIAGYSDLGGTGAHVKVKGGDLRELRIKRLRKQPGFVVRMKVRSLTEADLATALAETDAQSLLYALRFVNGFQPAAVVARYTPSASPQWSFQYDDYPTMTQNCEAPPSTGEKCLSFGVGGQPLKGHVNPSKGIIRVRVPVMDAGGHTRLFALKPGTQQRKRVRASSGSRFYDATLFSLADPSPSGSAPGTPQGYLYPVDNNPAIDFRLP